MAFDLNGIIIDRIETVIAENMSTGDLLYALTQVSEGNIEVSAESRDATDKDGNLIRRFWNSKTCQVTLTNTMLDLNMVANQSGTDKAVASVSTPIVMPRIMIVSNADAATVTLTGLVEGTLQVNKLSDAGTIGAKVSAGASAASASEYYLSGTTLTLPTSTTDRRYIIKFDRSATAATMVTNYADKFPKQIKLTVKVLAVDPCESDTLRAMYVIFPAFNPSPESTLSLTTDATFDYTGEAGYSYCAGEKVLYQIAMADEEEEE